MRPVCNRLTTSEALVKLGLKAIDRDRQAVKKATAALKAGVADWLTRQGPRVADQVIDALGLEKARARGANADAIALAGKRARAAAAALEFDQISKLVAVTEELLASIGLDGALAGVQQIGADVAAGLLTENTLPFAQARAAEMVGMKRNVLGQLVPNPDAKWRIDESTRDMVQTAVQRALEEGLSTDELKRELLDSQAFSEKRADMIARTEIARADMAGTMTGYRASGLVMGKRWSTSDDDLVSEECMDCERAGVIGLEDTFPSGADAPPNHPNCRCTVLPVLDDEVPALLGGKNMKDMDMTKLYAPIEKAEKQDDGTIKVYGYASSEVVDSDGETITADAMKAAKDGYMAFANVREMHDPKKAAGVAIEYDVQDDGKTWFGAHVVDPIAVKKVETGVYKGFSIGAKVPAGGREGKVIKAIELREVSLVDRPANPEAVFTMFKAEGAGDDEGQAEESVHKSTYTAMTLIDALGMVRGCCSDAEYEAKYGGHSAEVVAEMKGTLASIGAIAQKYLGEEIAAMLSPPKTAAADGGDLQKAGRRFSVKSKAALKAAHDACKAADKALTELGYDADEEEVSAAKDPENQGATANDDDKAGKAAAAVDLQKRTSEQAAAVQEIAKAAGLTIAEPTQDALTKAALTELLTLRKTHAELLASPAAPKGVVRASAVSKAADLGGEEKEPAPVVKSDGAVDDVATLVKAAQARPIRFA